jgi:predicted Ser/Thr protein kinase
MSLELESYSYKELKSIYEEISSNSDGKVAKTKNTKKTKKDIIDDIKYKMKLYESYKKEKIDKYVSIEKLGAKGKDGLVYLVESKDSNLKYAMKTFRSNKSSKSIREEARLQKIAAKAGISPTIIEYDTVFNYIVMEKLDHNLLDIMKAQNKELTKTQQNQLIKIFKKLDEILIFHSDPNPLNFMMKKNKMYIIDFGFAKEIDDKVIKKYGSTPNLSLMTLGFILKLKGLGCPITSYQYMLPYLKQDDIEKFGLNRI